MSDEGMTAPIGRGTPGQRLSDAERQAVIAALAAHRETGRLNSEEYEDRQVSASKARAWADVQPLFADLPQPHPVGMPAGAPGVQPLGTPAAGVEQPAQGLLGNLIPEHFRSTVMALTPFAALLLFFATDTWLWFLMIPIMGVLLYGPNGADGRQRDRNRRG
jgi:hypothetical protein